MGVHVVKTCSNGDANFDKPCMFTSVKVRMMYLYMHH